MSLPQASLEDVPSGQYFYRSACRWLIAIAFWLSGGFIKSGLGNRVAYVIVAAFGKTTLGLAYSLVFAEALLAPAIPSVAARAGGIFFPLVKALCLACGSDPVRLAAPPASCFSAATCELPLWMMKLKQMRTPLLAGPYR